MSTKSSGSRSGNGHAKRGRTQSPSSSDQDDAGKRDDPDDPMGAEDESTASDADTTGDDHPEKRGGTKERTKHSH